MITSKTGVPQSWTNEHVKVVRHFTPADKPDNFCACVSRVHEQHPHVVSLGNYGHGPWARHTNTRDQRYVTCEACLLHTPAERARRDRDAVRGHQVVTELLQLGASVASYEDRRDGPTVSLPLADAERVLQIVSDQAAEEFISGVRAGQESAS